MRQSLLQIARVKTELIDYGLMGREERRRILATVEDEVRAASWTLIQDSDRTLHLEQRARYFGEKERVRIVRINEFMRENGPVLRLLYMFIDRLFQQAEPASERGQSNMSTVPTTTAT